MFCEAYYNRGSAWGAGGEYDRAIADYNQAIRLDPKGAKAYYNRGMAWDKKRSLKAALADFKMHSQLAPSDPDGCEARIERIARKMTGGADMVDVGKWHLSDLAADADDVRSREGADLVNPSADFRK